MNAPIALIDAKAVAEHLNVKPSHVRALARRRVIPCVKLGYRTMRFKLSEVEAAIAKFHCTAV